MYARVATFEGADPAKIDENIEQMRGQERPENIPATGLYLLVDRAAGKTVAVALFETEEDMLQGHEALNALSPPVGAGMGSRSSVELYEVPLHFVA
jgi:hypothetical protein